MVPKICIWVLAYMCYENVFLGIKKIKSCLYGSETFHLSSCKHELRKCFRSCRWSAPTPLWPTLKFGYWGFKNSGIPVLHMKGSIWQIAHGTLQGEWAMGKIHCTSSYFYWITVSSPYPTEIRNKLGWAEPHSRFPIGFPINFPY